MLAGKLDEIRVHGINVSEGGADLPAFITQIGDLADEALRAVWLGDRSEPRSRCHPGDSGYLGEGYGSADAGDLCRA